MKREESMNLSITRDQSDVKGLFGGHKGVTFKVRFIANLSDGEKDLISKYFPKDLVVYRWDRSTDKRIDVEYIFANDLVSGKTIQCGSLPEILEVESGIIEGAKNLKGYLETAASFGGEEIIEI